MAGRGRGRGRGANDGLKGASWDFDPTLKLDAKPIDLYPIHANIRNPTPQTNVESLQVKYYRSLIEQIHRGPLYTRSNKYDSITPAKKFSEEQTNYQYGKSRKADIDPFFGVETYSMRYAPKNHELPKLSDRPFNKEMFPKELWPTLEENDSTGSRKVHSQLTQKKELILADMSSREKDNTKDVLNKINSIGVDGEDGDEEEVEEPAEDDEEFDDDELGGDYDAEQYFDGGEGDSDGDGGADEAY